MLPKSIKRCPPTPFDIKRLHQNAVLSRQRSRVRVPSSPPFIPKDLHWFQRNHRGPKRARFRAPFCVPFRSSSTRPVDSLTLQLRLMTTLVALHALRTATPTPRRLPQLHVWLALWLGCRYPMWIAMFNAAGVLASP